MLSSILRRVGIGVCSRPVTSYKGFDSYRRIIDRQWSIVQRLRFRVSRFRHHASLCSGVVLSYAVAEAVRPELNPGVIANISKEADTLFDDNKCEELLQLLRLYKESGKVELVWRLSRAAYTLSKSREISKAERAALIEESYNMAKLALELDPENAQVHKWMSIALDAYSALQGFRTRCKTLSTVKDHMIKSLELDPSDATMMYILGCWYHGVAGVSWYQRQILQAIGGKPPTATYEEALALFKKAEETSPNFYSLNLLMLGKCHLVLGDKDTAVVYLHRAVSYPKHSEDDHQAHKEASELLAKLLKG